MTLERALNAFHGDADFRVKALQRLAAHRDAGELTSGLLYQGRGKLSPAVALVGIAEPGAWQACTGLAAWLAYAVDTLASDKNAVEETALILDAINLGAHTMTLGSAVINAVLADLQCRTKALFEVRSELLALHTRAASGDAPSNTEWRSMRRLATAASDAIANDGDKRVAACIEASAWNPVQAPTSVAEVLRAQTELVNVDAQLGWDVVRNTKTKEKLGELHARFIESNPEEKRDVFQLLEEDDPQWAKEIRDYIAGQRLINREQLDRARELLVRVLRTAK